MSAVDLIAWCLSGSFWRFAGAAILLAIAGWSLTTVALTATRLFREPRA